MDLEEVQLSEHRARGHQKKRTGGGCPGSGPPAPQRGEDAGRRQARDQAEEDPQLAVVPGAAEAEEEEEEGVARGVGDLQTDPGHGQLGTIHGVEGGGTAEDAEEGSDNAQNQDHRQVRAHMFNSLDHVPRVLPLDPDFSSTCPGAFLPSTRFRAWCCPPRRACTPSLRGSQAGLQETGLYLSPAMKDRKPSTGSPPERTWTDRRHSHSARFHLYSTG